MYNAAYASEIRNFLEIKRLFLQTLEEGSLSTATAFITLYYSTYKESEEFVIKCNQHLSSEVFDAVCELLRAIYDEV